MRGMAPCSARDGGHSGPPGRHPSSEAGELSGSRGAGERR